MSYPRNEDFFLKYDYDFAVDGGAVSSISLSPKINALAEGVIIKEVELRVIDAVTSGGTPTITLGNTGDVDGYMADVWALVQAAGAVVNGGEVAGDLIWDDTNDHSIFYRIDSTANNQDLILAVGTAALTAGKMEIILRCGYSGYSDL